MNGPTFGLAVLTITQTLLVQPGRAAATNAVIPYKSLHEMFERLGGVNQTNLEICVFVVSTNQMMHPSGLQSFLVPKVEGVVFYFPSANAGKAKVEIKSKAGRKEYTADKDGQVKLKLEKALVSENPEVQVSEKPAGIAPDMSDL